MRCWLGAGFRVFAGSELPSNTFSFLQKLPLLIYNLASLCKSSTFPHWLIHVFSSTGDWIQGFHRSWENVLLLS